MKVPLAIVFFHSANTMSPGAIVGAEGLRERLTEVARFGETMRRDGGVPAEVPLEGVLLAELVTSARNDNLGCFLIDSPPPNTLGGKWSALHNPAYWPQNGAGAGVFCVAVADWTVTFWGGWGFSPRDDFNPGIELKESVHPFQERE